MHVPDEGPVAVSALRGDRPAEAAGSKPVLLSVENLTSRFFLPTGVVHAVEQVSFDLRQGESLGIVGESGSGKTATVMSLLRLLPAPGRIVGGSVRFEERELLELEEEEIRRIRGVRMALIPQNPGSALNPVLTIGWQLREALESHQDLSRSEADARIVEVLHLAGIPEPESQLERYPHEFSGGMKQRILIAMGVLNHPALLIADEPTTALDTTTQAKVLELMSDLVDSFGMALLIITHNMGVIASVCDRVAVMYDGRIVEEGSAVDLFRAPLHPYTDLLLKSTPRLDRRRSEPEVVGARRSTSVGEPIGCAFRERCPIAEEKCAEAPPIVRVAETRSVRCWVAQRESLARSAATGAAVSDRAPGASQPSRPESGSS